MVAVVKTVSFEGVNVLPIDVQVQIANGLPAFTIVGLPDKAVGESRERVRAALHAMGLSLPAKRLTVNLAPADVLKEGSHYDLPIALALLTAMEVLPADALSGYLALGELGLDAGLRSVSGVLPAAMNAAERDMGVICPEECGVEAVWAGEDVPVLAPKHLLQIINHIKGTQSLGRPHKQPPVTNDNKTRFDMAEIKGQESAKRAMVVAAAGGHNILLMGPPGSGKSMLASALPSLLPPLNAREALELSIVYSLAGLLPSGGLMMQRPYRDPHHSASLPSLVGGGHKAKPGEISLAHHGVLFLDELPEFQRAALEALRQPLEVGEAAISRVNYHITYPARFQLVAAMNPCRCGYLGDSAQQCSKAPKCGDDYQGKLSGPLLDRIDVHVEVPAVPVAQLSALASGESSAVLAQIVAQARHIAAARNPDGMANAALSGAAFDAAIKLEASAQTIMQRAAEKMRLSARGYTRLLKVARTIEDLAGGAELIGTDAVMEALSYRRLKHISG